MGNFRLLRDVQVVQWNLEHELHRPNLSNNLLHLLEGSRSKTAPLKRRQGVGVTATGYSEHRSGIP